MALEIVIALSLEDQEKIVAWGKRHPKIRQVWLYGSRARGDHRPDSDIDLAIVMSFAEWWDWHEEYNSSPDLQLSVEVDLEWYEKDAGLEIVGPGVENDGVLLYTTTAM
jgi:predicted nucleotidyltransferase